MNINTVSVFYVVSKLREHRYTYWNGKIVKNKNLW